MGLHRPRSHPSGETLLQPSLRPGEMGPIPLEGSITASVQPLLEHVTRDGYVESSRVSRAWDLHEMPEVRFACRQYSNAFAQTKMVLGKREVLWEDPKPILEPASDAEQKALELLEAFAGGPVGQGELLDRMGTYFMVPGDMVMVGAYDPARMADSEFAQWDVWSTSEVRWDGRNFKIRKHATEDIFQDVPDYIRHVRVWNRHPRRGWESDSPVLAAIDVLELVGLYDDRLVAETLSRLIGAGVWMIPQGMNLPSKDGKGGDVNDFLELLKMIAGLSIKDRRAAGALVPILIEAAAEDIEAASKGRIDFSTDYSERILELQEAAIRRWATGVDLPAETMLGMAQATHWNANLISEDRVQTFIVPSLKRGFGSLTTGWLRPTLKQFGHERTGLELWFDPAGIKTRVDLGEETQWASDRFMVVEGDTKYALGLGQTKTPDNEDLKRMMLLHMARTKPEFVPDVLRELGIDTKIVVSKKGSLDQAVQDAADQAAKSGHSGPQEHNAGDRGPANGAPGRAATLSTTRK